LWLCLGEKVTSGEVKSSNKNGEEYGVGDKLKRLDEVKRMLEVEFLVSC
jgi:hypothetical protein